MPQSLTRSIVEQGQSFQRCFGITGAAFNWMKRVIAFVLAIAWLTGLPFGPAVHAEVAFRPAAVQTNWVDRWITNTAEVRMQVNRYVTEFHTNWVNRMETNFVDLFATNVVTKYHTNWIAQFRTNVVNVFATNVVPRTVTNTVALTEVQTNFVRAYHTNLQTLNLTNWTTVLAFKTNWINKPLTNVVEIELPREAAPASTQTAPRPSTSNEALSLQASRHPKTTTNNQVEVQLTVSWTQAPGAPVQVQQWRIEREDGSILCFGQDTEFKRALPVGTYKVLVKAQRDARSPLMAVLGTLTVTSREVVIEQRPARSNSST